MTLGTWKFTKIRRFNFLQLSWPRVHENSKKSEALIFFNFHDPGYMKIHKNWTLQFCPIFMTPGTWKSQKSDTLIFLNFHDPGYVKIHKNETLQFSSIFMTPGTWKFKKIRRFDFFQLSWPRVHENSQKLDASILSNFHDPGYVKIHNNQTL